MMYTFLTRVPALVGARRSTPPVTAAIWPSRAAGLWPGHHRLRDVIAEVVWRVDAKTERPEFEDQNIIVARHQTTRDDLQPCEGGERYPAIDKGSYEGPERNGCERPPPW